jgi:hypothetical protein
MVSCPSLGRWESWFASSAVLFFVEVGVPALADSTSICVEPLSFSFEGEKAPPFFRMTPFSSVFWSFFPKLDFGATFGGGVSFFTGVRVGEMTGESAVDPEDTNRCSVSRARLRAATALKPPDRSYE